MGLFPSKTMKVYAEEVKDHETILCHKINDDGSIQKENIYVRFASLMGYKSVLKDMKVPHLDKQIKALLDTIVEKKILYINYFEIDSKGRYLSYISTRDMCSCDKKISINEKLVEKGLLMFHRSPGMEHDKHNRRLEAAEDRAREEKLGIWKYLKEGGILKDSRFTSIKSIPLNTNFEVNIYDINKENYLCAYQKLNSGDVNKTFPLIISLAQVDIPQNYLYGNYIGQLGSIEASKFLIRNFTDKKVVVNVIKITEDNILICKVYKSEISGAIEDKDSIAYIMTKEGLCQTNDSKLKEIQDIAKKEKKGLWSFKFIETGSDYHKRVINHYTIQSKKERIPPIGKDFYPEYIRVSAKFKKIDNGKYMHAYQELDNGLFFEKCNLKIQFAGVSINENDISKVGIEFLKNYLSGKRLIIELYTLTEEGYYLSRVLVVISNKSRTELIDVNAMIIKNGYGVTSKNDIMRFNFLSSYLDDEKFAIAKKNGIWAIKQEKNSIPKKIEEVPKMVGPTRICAHAYKVTDGDTVRLFYKVDGKKIKLNVRFMLIDAPETPHLNWNKLWVGQPHGKKAQKYVSKLIIHQNVMIHKYGVGYYGRSLGLIYTMKDGKEDVNVNLALLKNGLAVFIRGTIKMSKSLEDKFIEAEKIAKTEKKNIWSEKNFESPYHYRRRIKKEIKEAK